MVRINPVHKAMLQQTGKWSAFVTYRNELRIVGDDPETALIRAVDKFLGPEAAKTAVDSTGLPAPSKRKKGDIDYEPALLRDFAGKEAKEVDIIRWVARSMDVLDITPEQAPDAAAWSLLQQCRSDPSFRTDFWKSMYTKIIPNRNLLDDEKGDSDVDGTPEAEMIDKLIAIRVLAKKGEI
jgi:hypothetical protein